MVLDVFVSKLADKLELNKTIVHLSNLVANTPPLVYNNSVLKAVLVALTLSTITSHILSLLIIFLEVFANVII